MSVPAENFCATLAANVDNEKLTDAEFRQFVRDTLAIVSFPRLKTHNVESMENPVRTDDTEARWQK